MKNLKKIPGYENYLIAENGSIYNLRTDSFLNIFKNKSGYLCVTLSKNGIIKLCYIHKLLVQANHPKLNIKRVSFKDKDKNNVNIDNLKFKTNDRL